MAWWILQNVVITAALAALVATICRVFPIGPVARHALWVLVLVKFVTPPLVVWPWAVPDPLGIATVTAAANDRQEVATLAAEPDALSASHGDDVALKDRADDVSQGDRRDRAMAAMGATAWPWLLGMWAAGSLCLLGIEGVRLARLARRVRTAAPAGPAIVNRVAALSARLGLSPVPVVAVGGRHSPVVWCFGRPILLWPEELSADSPAGETDACVDGLLVHELAHVKRGDHLVGWIELAAGVVWWWNPLFWFVRSALREQAELACDAWVVSALPNGRRAYAESLLALSGAAVRGASSMAVVGIRATSRRVLERRLVMIMKGRAPLRLPWVGLLCLALMAAATLPAWATASQQAPPSPPPAPVARPVQVAPLPPSSVVVAPVPRVAGRIRIVPQNPPPPPPTPPPAPPARIAAPVPHRVAAPEANSFYVVRGRLANLTDEGQRLIDGFEKDRDAIQQEADKKIEARKAAAVKALQDLQDQYAKAGKLDEAVAIRDYLRAGGPGNVGNFIRVIKR